MSDQPLIPFAEWRPDVSDYNQEYTDELANVLPRGDGYGPFPDFSALTSALAGPCRGFFRAINTDGSITTFAATSTKIYKLSNTNFTWSDVSKGSGSYSALSSTDQWQFVQYINFVIAVQANVVPQFFDLTSSTLFADLGGSPPQARYIAVVGSFVVLTGLLSNPYRVQWSALGDPASWTAGVNSSSFQDLPDGGIVRGVAGGEYGNIFQDTTIRRLIYAPGSPVIFQIVRITEDRGLYAPYSLTRSGDKIFFISSVGFMQMDPSGYPIPIGKEKVDRTFLADVDTTNIQLVIGASDPQHSRVMWGYKSSSSSTTGQFNKIICYDYALNRFTPASIFGEYIGSISQPGLTLENIDALAGGILNITGAVSGGGGKVRLTLNSEVGSWTYGQADTTHNAGDAGTTDLTNASQNTIEVYGVVGTTEANGHWRFTVVDATHIELTGSTFANAYVSGGHIGGALDSVVASLDSFSVATTPQIAMFNASHLLGFLRGLSLEATLATASRALAGRRVTVRSIRPETDATTVYGSIGKRERLSDTETFTSESAMRTSGYCPLRASTRIARGKIRIPAAINWSYAMGVEPDIALEGAR